MIRNIEKEKTGYRGRVIIGTENPEKKEWDCTVKRKNRDDCKMQLFLDTANLDEIRQGAETGLITGVTTNRTLIMKEGKDYKKTLKEICGIVKGPISAE